MCTYYVHVLQDLYQIAFTKGACPPFDLYSTTPQRTKVPCDEKMHRSSLSGTLLMIQECCKTIDINDFLDFLEVSACITILIVLQHFY